jgi:hypothetical protein
VAPDAVVVVVPVVVVPVVVVVVVVEVELLELLDEDPPPPHPVSVAPARTAAPIMTAFDTSPSITEPRSNPDGFASRKLHFG